MYVPADLSAIWPVSMLSAILHLRILNVAISSGLGRRAFQEESAHTVKLMDMECSTYYCILGSHKMKGFVHVIIVIFPNHREISIFP